MTHPTPQEMQWLWDSNNEEWRNPAQIIAHWFDTSVDERLIHHTETGDWRNVLDRLGITLLFSREYEHLLMAMRVKDNKPIPTYMKLPHPSGMAVDYNTWRIYVASTRNPNQIWDLAPVTGITPRLDIDLLLLDERPLLPIRSRLLPGYMYLHDLALINGQLHANSVGQNAIVRFDETGQFERVWWPRCVERQRQPIFGQNYIQLNSIAAGPDITHSFFSASTEQMSDIRPGHKDFLVDKQGVIFAGATREPMARGLTRPHSARLYQGKVWVDNSGYGELGYAEDGCFYPYSRLPGWTRGLCFTESIAFVGTSRVIPRFAQYAPGLDVEKSVCGLHAIDIPSGKVLGSITWPYGNQIFAIEAVPNWFTTGFLYPIGTAQVTARDNKILYALNVWRFDNAKKEASS